MARARTRARRRPKGGGNFRSEAQRRYFWAKYPKAARKLAHRRKPTRKDWSTLGRYYDPAKDPKLKGRKR